MGLLEKTDIVISEELMRLTHSYQDIMSAKQESYQKHNGEISLFWDILPLF